MPRSTSAGRMPAPHPTLPGAKQPQVSSVHKSSGKLGLLNSFFFFFFPVVVLVLFSRSTGQKKVTAVNKSPTSW